VPINNACLQQLEKVIKEFHIVVDIPSRPAVEMFSSMALLLPGKVIVAPHI
jgi:hypothetical protein